MMRQNNLTDWDIACDRHKIDRLKLKKARRALGLTQEKAADLCGVSRITLTRWEKGFVHPSLDQVCMLEDMFGFEPGELLSEKEV